MQPQVPVWSHGLQGLHAHHGGRHSPVGFAAQQHIVVLQAGPWAGQVSPVLNRVAVALLVEIWPGCILGVAVKSTLG